MEIGVLRDDREPVFGGVLPDRVVIRSLQADIAEVGRARVEVADDVKEPAREVLVEKQSHAGGTETNLRSRSAAKARQARMSSRVKSGKSRRISSWVIPDGRYSRTSMTVIRRPLRQGLPPRLPGSKVIRERQSMEASLRRGSPWRQSEPATAVAPRPELARPRGRSPVGGWAPSLVVKRAAAGSSKGGDGCRRGDRSRRGAGGGGGGGAPFRSRI